jgi:hypothetical protein
MRKTVCKRLRKQAVASAPPTEYRGRIRRFMTDKKDYKGRQVVIDRTTVVCIGMRRAYQDLKKAYRKGRAS